jgi:thymidylate synthase ThyX
VARDWHRHRTLYPWHLGVVLSEGLISIDRRYEPKSELGRSKLPELLRRSTELYQRFLAAGDVERAALALPLGTKVVVSASGGLRDVVYMLELRAHAHGANFEYKEQAEAALHHLEIRMRLAFMSFDSEESLYSGSGFHPEVRGR